MKPKVQDLILDAKTGNAEAFHALVAYHDEKIMTLALQLTRHRQDAEDLYQEVFLKAYKNIESFRMESSFYTWLYRIMVNAFLNHQRKEEKITIQESSRELPNPVESISAQPQPDTEVSERINQILMALPKQQKTVFILKHFQGLKIREISDMMNISSGTIKKYLFRAMEKMRFGLKEYQYGRNRL
ncbi:MAG: RNA polymerase sigma factor [Candidatus Marinimicrobia bacterium]|nr:RNA polymerase sigma factor [Candidatus Neomarinimicrobiota bacterium]MBT3496162.1 RNA polymerase sigma factor [Candidatus Neomarinimicrobiota bacterium]MBT3692800.1 RNA polymerase sigma factor [Candidatus Neomarinimicrobiota bacterium]MBT3731833.1 RNA polymerase sigma factor [Candidatus Neomarinimicrobiota bacterium]MBT4145078.1 RNA polymerase sigma factor [Candidatus Neomarinimicrobiota bacterium]